MVIYEDIVDIGKNFPRGENMLHFVTFPWYNRNTVQNFWFVKPKKIRLYNLKIFGGPPSYLKKLWLYNLKFFGIYIFAQISRFHRNLRFPTPTNSNLLKRTSLEVQPLKNKRLFDVFVLYVLTIAFQVWSRTESQLCFLKPTISCPNSSLSQRSSLLTN